jgi:hypothetical protein
MFQGALQVGIAKHMSVLFSLHFFVILHYYIMHITSQEHDSNKKPSPYGHERATTFVRTGQVQPDNHSSRLAGLNQEVKTH